MANKIQPGFEGDRSAHNRRGFQLRQQRRNAQNYSARDNVLAQNKKISDIAAELYGQNQWKSMAGFRERILVMGFDTLERVAERCHPISMFVQHRKRQVLAFCQPAIKDGDRGFRVYPRPGLEGEKSKIQARCRELEDFILKTGWDNDPEREDDFPDFMEYLTRDLLVFDQNAIEIQRSQQGKAWAYWYIDPTTIKRVDRSNPKWDGKTIFVQEINDSQNRLGVVAEFTADNLIFDYSNKRSRLKYRGYGYSLVEMSVDLITTVLFAQSYNRDLFTREKIPKGFLKVMGDVSSQTLNSIRNAWVSEMSGYGGKFAVPIVPSGKEGVGIEWQNLGQTSRDMEYHKLIMLMLSMLGGIWGIDLAELGIKTDDSTAVIGESGDSRIQNSRDAGLGNLLAYSERVVNKILRFVDPNFVFRFEGLKNDDPKARAEAIRVEVEAFKTVNEVRETAGLPPIEGKQGDLILNPQYIQAFMAMQQQGGGVPDGGDDFGDGWDGPDGGDGEDNSQEAVDADKDQGGENGEGDNEKTDGNIGKPGDNKKGDQNGGKAAGPDLSVAADAVKKIGKDDELTKAYPSGGTPSKTTTPTGGAGVHGLPVGTVHRFNDGYWYVKAVDGWKKVHQNREKAQEFADKMKASSKVEAKTGVEIGHTVRIKPTDKTTSGVKGGGGRGLVAKVTEIRDGMARLVDQAGQHYSVRLGALEFAKSAAAVHRTVVRVEI